jgi:hypothetical protein
MTDMSEYWIDLMALGDTTNYENGLMVISKQYPNKSFIDDSNTYIYLMRQAIRNVGHKILSMQSTYDKEDHRLLQISFSTDISDKDGDKMTRFYNTWVGKVCDEFVN